MVADKVDFPSKGHVNMRRVSGGGIGAVEIC